MNQSNSSIDNKIENLCKMYEVHFMEDLISWLEQHRNFSVDCLNNTIEYIGELQNKANNNDAIAQQRLGFCYEQGLSDQWVEEASKIFEICIRSIDDMNGSDTFINLENLKNKRDMLSETNDQELFLQYMCIKAKSYEDHHHESHAIFQNNNKELKRQYRSNQVLNKLMY